MVRVVRDLGTGPVDIRRAVVNVESIGVSFPPATITTMPHRALRIDEILREVAAWVVGTHPPTAVSLACCAKPFEEPALHALWETQKELLTLIKTLPPDCWKFLPPAPSREKGLIVRGSLQSMALD